MINFVEKLMLTKFQEQIIEQLLIIIDKTVSSAFEKDMNFILTVTDPDKDECFSLSNLHSNKVFQIYIDIFSGLKMNMKKDSRIAFTRKLVSSILKDTEEKEACFYWLLDELHKTENIHVIKS